MGALATARDQVEENRRAAAPEQGPVPRQLPLDVFGFTGRAAQLAELDAALAAGERRPAVVISAVAGTAGVGKTALAVHWSHRVARRFPGGQLYMDLRGYDPGSPVTAADALAAFLRALGVRPADIPEDLDERAARYRTLLAGRRVLVVLDNAHGADHVRPLLPGSASCMVVVTSRDALTGLVAREGALRIDLTTLTAAEAAGLLRGLIGPRVDETPDDAAALAEACARLPLALRVAAEMATSRPTAPLSELVAELRDEARRLDLLDAAGDTRTAVRSVFSWSHRHLSGEAARLFDLLGLHPGREFDMYGAAALAGTGTARAAALLDELARGHLIEQAGPGRYAMHDLLRAFAVERATGGDEPLTRLFDHYLSTAAAAMDTLYPYERGRPAVPPPRTPGPPVGDADQASRWLERERPALVAVAVHAARHGRPRHAVDLSRVLWRHLEVHCHSTEALTLHGAAAEAALATGHGVAGVLTNLGAVHWWLGDHHQAGATFEQALASARREGDAEGEARVLGRLGLVHERLGDLDRSLAVMRAALAVFERTGNRHAQGTQFVNIGIMCRRLGRYEEAAAYQTRAAEVFTELGDRRLRGYALGNLGALDNLLGRYAEALEHLGRSLADCRAARDPGGEGSAIGTTGAVYLRLGRHAEALDHLHRALAISRETADRNLEVETLNTLGETLSAMGQPGAALTRHRAALTLAERTGDRYEHARATDGIAHVLARTGHEAEAREHWRAALATYRSLGVPDADRVPAGLGDPPPATP
nr:tetratricopeptide repeat protein [Sphaerisporangium rubeum]